MGKRVIGVIQARMGSTRLPGKVLRPLYDGYSMLECIYARLAASDVDDVVVAFPEHDAALEQLVIDNGWKHYMGSEQDLIGRIGGAAFLHSADAIVRITGDCPFVDPLLVNALVAVWRNCQYDYVSNVCPPTFPDGFDVEVYSTRLLDALNQQIPFWCDYREWFPKWVWEGRSGVETYNYPSKIDLSRIRCTVDTQEDLEFARWVFSELGLTCSMQDILYLLAAHPERTIIKER